MIGQQMLEEMLVVLGWEAREPHPSGLAMFWRHPELGTVLVCSERAADYERRTAETISELAERYDCPDITTMQALWIMQVAFAQGYQTKEPAAPSNFT